VTSFGASAIRAIRHPLHPENTIFQHRVIRTTTQPTFAEIHKSFMILFTKARFFSFGLQGFLTLNKERSTKKEGKTGGKRREKEKGIGQRDSDFKFVPKLRIRI
jgi:hypothetical protein